MLKQYKGTIELSPESGKKKKLFVSVRTTNMENAKKQAMLFALNYFINTTACKEEDRNGEIRIGEPELQCV